MKMTQNKWMGAALAILVVSGGLVAHAAGFLTNGLPGAGGSQYPTTLPLTGNETIPVDTNLASGLNPASEAVTVQQLIAAVNGSQNSSGFRNALIGGDFGNALWQRGTAVSSDIAATLTYYADGWFNKGNASSAINVTKATGATDITSTFIASLKFQRKSANADVNPICTGQVLTTAESARFQGQTAEFAVAIQSGANFSAASGNVKLTIGYSVAGSADQSADTFIGTPGSLGTWTGQVNTSGTYAVTSSFARYSVVASIPATSTQVGVSVCYTPVGTASTNDWIELALARLQVAPGAVAQTGVSGTGYSVYSFEHVPVQAEAARERFFYWQLNETNGGYIAPGMVAATNVERATLSFPVPMRATPTCTFTAGGLKWDIAGTDTAVTTLTQVTGSSATVLTIGDTTTATVGGTSPLFGSNTTGAIKCSAEL